MSPWADRLRSWAGTDPALRGLDTPADLEAAVAGAGRERVDAVLDFLLCRAWRGAPADRDVAAIVLQLMSPRAARLARCEVSRRHGVVISKVHRQALAVSCLYDAIQCYPLHRTTRVAANLAACHRFCVTDVILVR